MKIISLSNSFLFLFINPKTDIVKCYLFYRIGWFNYKNCFLSFNLNTFSLVQTIELYKTLVNHWDRKYRI